MGRELETELGQSWRRAWLELEARNRTWGGSRLNFELYVASFLKRSAFNKNDAEHRFQQEADRLAGIMCSAHFFRLLIDAAVLDQAIVSPNG